MEVEAKDEICISISEGDHAISQISARLLLQVLKMPPGILASLRVQPGIEYSQLNQSEDTANMASPKFSDPVEELFPEDGSQGDFRSIDPESGVKRGLKTRHLSMMALAGIIGPGLLVGSGGALSSGGPASLLIGFGIIGIIAFR